MAVLGYCTTGDSCERLRRTARLSEKAEAARIRAELRADRGDHRRRAAARGASGVVVGDAAQPAGKDAAARGLPCRRLYRHAAGGWEKRAVQADEVKGEPRSIKRHRPGEDRPIPRGLDERGTNSFRLRCTESCRYWYFTRQYRRSEHFKEHGGTNG